jgi:hypothetical protein
MGADTSKLKYINHQNIKYQIIQQNYEDPSIFIQFKNESSNKEGLSITIYKSMKRNGMITVADLVRNTIGETLEEKAILFEFEKGSVDEKDVCKFVSASIQKHLQEYDAIYLSNNFGHANNNVQFSEKTFGDMMEHVQELVKFMIQASSLFVSELKSNRSI